MLPQWVQRLDVDSTVSVEVPIGLARRVRNIVTSLDLHVAHCSALKPAPPSHSESEWPRVFGVDFSADLSLGALSGVVIGRTAG